MKKLGARHILPLLLVGVAALWFTRGQVAASERVTTLPKPAVDQALVSSSGQESTVFAGGCFWGVQAVFQHVKGVVSATSGYSGGSSSTASYYVVASGTTNHAESVKVVYDPSKITYGELLQVFFSVAHDPTQLNRQGPDEGTQYRSVIFYANDEQKRIADAYIAQLDAAKVFPSKIVTQVVPLKAFYPAESYHQDYAKLHPDNPYIEEYDLPKLTALQQVFPQLYRNR
jgi:peptide-methionine (S)-S-oxide reductase